MVVPNLLMPGVHPDFFVLAYTNMPVMASVYDLVGPIFLGTFLALVTILALMGKARYLLVGPAMLFDRGYARPWNHKRWGRERHQGRRIMRRGAGGCKRHRRRAMGAGARGAARAVSRGPCDGSKCGCSMCAAGTCSCSSVACRCPPSRGPPRIESLDVADLAHAGPAPQSTPWQPNVLPPAWRSAGLKTGAAPVFSSSPFEHR